MTDMKERDALIVQLAKSGRTAMSIARQVGVSRAWVYVVCREAGVELAALHQKIKRYTNRNQFLGLNTSKSVKSALHEATTQQGVSVSEYANDALAEKLKRDGFIVETERLITRQEKIRLDIERTEQELARLQG